VEQCPLDGATILREAREWIGNPPDVAVGRDEEFARWIRYSPEHLKAYLLLRALYTELAG
jgi:ferric-dicitrate binding protein FerR (iron transport regulator)